MDYLQLMSGGSKRYENRTQEVSAISRGLKALAKELSVPVIALSQLSRAPESRGGDHRPQLADLRESGSIEQDADLVMFIFREEVYKQDDPDLQGKAEIIISKQRNGPIGQPESGLPEELHPIRDNGGGWPGAGRVSATGYRNYCSFAPVSTLCRLGLRRAVFAVEKLVELRTLLKIAQRQSYAEVDHDNRICAALRL